VNRKLKAQIVLKFGTQHEFGRAVGVQQKIISEIIHGHRPISPQRKLKWAIALGCSVEEIFPAPSPQIKI
jgi:plasmid maintenance system antidote protein VapI